MLIAAVGEEALSDGAAGRIDQDPASGAVVGLGEPRRSVRPAAALAGAETARGAPSVVAVFPGRGSAPLGGRVAAPHQLRRARRLSAAARRGAQTRAL